MKKTKISLVLGGGGARGLAHIGVIHYLEEVGFQIKYLSGTSMGALIGGIYAAGKLDVYEKWVCELDKRHVVRLLDWSFNRGAIFKGEKIIGVLKELVGDRNIEDLPIGFTAVATDLNTEREVWFNHGSLFDAIKASIAIPMVFEPVISGKRLLVDGSLVNPVPIAPTLNHDTDITIAVDLNAGAEGYFEKQDLQQIERNTRNENDYRSRLIDFIEGLFSSDAKDESEEIPGFYDLMMRSMDAMQSTITSFKLAAYNPEVIINVPRDLCDFFEFYRARELIDFGYNRAKSILEKTDLE